MRTDDSGWSATRTPSNEFADIYGAYLVEIVRYMRRRLGEDAADDAAAEVFLRALRSGRPANYPHDTRLPWLYGIAANVIAERRRAEVRRLRALERLASQPQNASHDPEQRPRLDPRLMRALRNLKQIDRETLLLIAWGDLTYEQTAAALDVPIGTVRSRIARARRQLKTALAPRELDTDPSPTIGKAHARFLRRAHPDADR